ncbi:hypothetical protein LguiB_020520 [Lonicera macranthoides]
MAIRSTLPPYARIVLRFLEIERYRVLQSPVLKEFLPRNSNLRVSRIRTVPSSSPTPAGTDDNTLPPPLSSLPPTFSLPLPLALSSLPLLPPLSSSMPPVIPPRWVPLRTIEYAALKVGSLYADQEVFPNSGSIIPRNLSKTALCGSAIERSNFANRPTSHAVLTNEECELAFGQNTKVEVGRPYAKYEVEITKTQSCLVNIRCVYNNKYFVTRSHDDRWIIVVACEPEEDRSEWSCTLSQHVFIDSKTIRLHHVHLGHYATVQRTGYIYGRCVALDKDQKDVFSVIDWESLLILPKHVAFKGDNGKYLSSKWIESHEYLQFISDDIGDPSIGHETFTTTDGSIRI